MSDIEKARQVFQKAGLAFPTIPEKLAEQLKEQSKFVFSTRPIDEWPTSSILMWKKPKNPKLTIMLCFVMRDMA